MGNNTENSGKDKPKPRYKPKSPEYWEDFLKNDTRGGFLIWREMYRSDPFRELRRNPKYVLVWLEAWSQLNFEGKPKKDERQVNKQGMKSNKKSRVYKDDGIIYLTQNRLKAIGVSVGTQAGAKKALVELGFLDVVVDPTSARDDQFGMSIFRVSNRWRKYPNVPPQEDGVQTSRRVFPDNSLSNANHPIHRKRQEVKEQKRIQELNAKSTIQELNAKDSVAIQPLNAF